MYLQEALMLFFKSLEEGLPFFRALSSKVRIKILDIITKESEVNLNELAKRLQITNGALTTHIKILESAGLIGVKTISARHGTQKICSVHHEKYLVHIGDHYEAHSYSTEIAPGMYIDYSVTPTCGIATTEKIIGVYDEPCFFGDVEHFKAQIIYFTSGFVEYEIPNYIPDSMAIRALSFTAELGSEAVSFCNDYPSDIHFSINDELVGVWQSPGDFGGERGVYNPAWWIPSMNQFGTLMEMHINEYGTFFDNKKLGSTTIKDLGIFPGEKIKLRLAVPEGLPDSRGLTIFGRGFGNHNSGMTIRITYG
jgi:predicted transcriptional regulator